MGRYSNKKQRRDNLAGYAFIAPAMFGFLAFLAYPIVSSMAISLFEWDIMTPAKWVGFNNYIKLMHDEIFIASLVNTLKWVLVYVPTTIIFAFILALAAELPLKGITVYRTFFYLPYISPLLVVALMFVWLYNPEFGLFNYFLSLLGLPSIPWLTDPNIAILSVAAMSVWKAAGYNMVILLAALKGIPVSLYEASELDGITTLKKIWYIKIPLLSPAFFFVIVMAVIYAFQVFSEILIMTRGGPGYSTHTLTYYMYNTAFKYNQMGYSNAISLVMTVLILIVTIAQNYILGKRVQYDL